MHIVCILSSVTARSQIRWCSQPGDGLPLASDAFAESMRARADLNTRIRIAHRSRSLVCGTQARDGPPSSIHALTSRDVALCVTRTGVGFALTDHSITELARQRAKPNAWQHPRRVLARCAAHGRASPSTLCQARSKRDHRQDASRDYAMRNIVRRFFLLTQELRLRRFPGNDAIGSADSTRHAIAKRGTKLRNGEQNPSVRNDLSY